MTQLVRIGHSPDADDAFMFYALTHGKVAIPGVRIEHVLEDIESLNRRAATGELEVTAVSCATYPGIAARYRLMDPGASMGKGYGPIVVAREPIAPESLPDRVIESIKKNKVAIKAPITTPVGSGFRSVNVALRKELDLYCCLRPCKAYEGVRTRFDDVDLVIVRENTEDLYAGIEYEQGKPETDELIAWIEARGGKLRHADAGISIDPTFVKVVAWYDNEWAYSCKVLEMARVVAKMRGPAIIPAAIASRSATSATAAPSVPSSRTVVKPASSVLFACTTAAKAELKGVSLKSYSSS